MSEVSVAALRALRAQAEELLKYAGEDLFPFLNDDGLTFLRTPESPRGTKDVNVTTTCSCLMSLALTDQFKSVYKVGDCEAQAEAAFNRLVQAPWMSSGLTENNAFTTTLVIRTLGFFSETDIGSVSGQPDIKEWDLRSGIIDFPRLLKRLKKRPDPESQFLWRSLSDAAHISIDKWQSGQRVKPSMRRLVTLEVQRVIESSWIYEPTRFPSASTKTRTELRKTLLAYDRVAANRRLLADAFDRIFAKSKKRSLGDIAKIMASDENNFTINKYPPTAAVIYWFVDGVKRAKLNLPGKHWLGLCRWARDEFNHQLSLVVAQHEAMMDPVAMAMSACLCATLRALFESPDSGTLKPGTYSDHLTLLPSTIELEHAIGELFKRQRNGIWPKYFPLFHYQDAGSNFCFTFELLEAVLTEFGHERNKLLDSNAIIHGLQTAVTWCQQNRLKWQDKSQKSYSGWNSGGYLETLQKGQPESWATAVVHMFLWELQKVLSERIQTRLISDYHASSEVNLKALDKFLSIDIYEKSKSRPLKRILRSQIISKYLGKTPQTLRKQQNKAARSALLFGPPGTSKTEVVQAVAKELGWPLIQIDPSHFLRKSLEGIYTQAGEIFTDLMDLSGVIVLFDEMDALVQTRDSDNKLDTAAQFLTTFMLPKLAALHDQGRIVFFMATNFQDRFDDAIKRAGRFDLLLCMGPPSLTAKLKALHIFTDGVANSPENKAAIDLLSQYVNESAELKMQLELYTFAEFKSLIKALTVSTPLSVRLNAMTAASLAQFVESDSQSAALQLRELKPTLTELKLAAKTITKLKQLPINREELRRKKIRETRIIQYFIDRKLSRISL